MILQERVPAAVHAVTIHARTVKSLALAKAVLSAAGWPAEKIAEDEEQGRICLKIFLEDAQKAQALCRLFKKLSLSGVAVSRKRLRPGDWLTRWKAHWKPAPLTKHMDVVPVWCKDRYRPRKGRDYILMDTLLSFGTGLHETTRAIARFIEEGRGQFKTFMDIGTGTGILTIMALKNGAEQAFAVDIGDLSVQAAKDNFKANRVKAVVRAADIKTLRHAARYDFVAANLVTHDLLALRRQIIRFVKPGGYLAVSGISLEHLAKFRRGFGAAPLTCIKTIKGKQWAGLLYKKQMS